MTLETTEALLGERELNSYSGPTLAVTVWVPTVTPHGDFECRYRITGAGDERAGRSVGIDGIQAVLLALKKIGSDIGFLEDTLSTEFFIGSGERLPSHGFPEIEGTRQID